MKIIDANIVLRYLLKDNTTLFNKAVKIIEGNNLYIPNEIIAEIVYVLEKVYLIPKNEIKRSLNLLFDYPNISMYDEDIIFEALKSYNKFNLDFADALLIAYNQVLNAEIFTFDKKIKSIIKN